MDNTEVKPIDEILPDAPAIEGTPSPSAQTDAAPDTRPESDATKDAEAGKGWSYRAMKSERAKRQALEQELQQLRDERAQLMQAREDNARDEFWANPEQKIQRIEATALRAVATASETAAIAVHGREVIEEMNAAIDAAIKAGDPDMPLLREACLQSNDPAAVAMEWYRTRGTGASQPSQAFPSNLATVRNAGARSKPAWAGPVPLDDIFERGRP